MESLLQLFLLDISSLLLDALSYHAIWLLHCKAFSANISIILQELLGFSSSVLGGFSHGISSHMWMNELCG